MIRFRLLLIVAIAVLVLVPALHRRSAHAGVAPTARTERHMEMMLRTLEKPGVRERADAILTAARAVRSRYSRVADAERDSFEKFLPAVPLPIEHYASRRYALEAWFGKFDPSHPTSLLYKRTRGRAQARRGHYTASNQADQNDLDRRVPLSFSTWHRHIDFCWLQRHDRDQNATRPADVLRRSSSAGWVHVWPNEQAPRRIWAAEMDGEGHARSGMVGETRTFNGLPIVFDRLPVQQVAPGDATRGADVFARSCAGCHGAAERDGTDAPSLTGAGLAAGQVVFMVRHPAQSTRPARCRRCRCRSKMSPTSQHTSRP